MPSGCVRWRGSAWLSQGNAWPLTQACPNGQKDIETKRLLIDIEKGMDSADSIVFEEVGLAGRTPMNAHSTGYSCNRTIHAAKLLTLLFADMPLPSARG